MARSGLRRVYFMDELRGFLIIFVVLYHLLYDLTVIFPVEIPWMFSPWMNTLRDLFTGTLITISGISCLYSRSNIRRGFKTLGCGLILTAATYFFIPGQIILFGILHFFGCAMILYGLVEKLFSHIPAWIGFPLSVFLFFFTRNIYYGVVGLGGFSFYMPAFLYGHPLLFPLGFACPGIFSADYYPIIPWVFLFFAGAFLGRFIRAGKAPDFLYRRHFPPLAFVGRHTLFIYMVHQPVLYGILYLIFRGV